jgi:dihydroceramidase
VTAVYLIFKIPLIHQVAYGVIVSVVLYLDICVAKHVPCDIRLFYYASICYYSGFFVWNIDNIFCHRLQELRERLPQVLVPFTQLHALWHCLAGYGSYLHIVYYAQAKAMSERKALVWRWTGISIDFIPSHKAKL